MTSPSDDSFIEVLSYIAEIPHKDAFAEDTTSTTHDGLPVIDNAIKVSKWQAGVSTSASGSSIAWSTAAASPSRSQARAPRFHSYTRLDHTPISYDVASTPSARTVVDRTLHLPFVPSPLVPSPPRLKPIDLPSKTPAAQNKAWQAAGAGASTSGSSTYGPEPSPSRSQARAPRFHMHPLLSYTRLHHAPISYDVAFTPSARTVVDRTQYHPFIAVTLAQPATEPPIPASSRLVLQSPKLPWVVVVGPFGAPPSFFTGKDGEKRQTKSSAVLTNLDVLYAVHSTLMTCVTPGEWHSIGEGSRAQHRVAEAYEERCTRMGGGWEGGVRRVDWLGYKTHLVGVETNKSNEPGENVGRLVFGLPP